MWNYRFLRLSNFYRKFSIRHTRVHCVPTFHWCIRTFLCCLCFLKLLYGLYHFLLEFLLLFTICSTFFSWNTCSYVILLLVATFTSTTFTYVVTYFPFWIWCIFPLEQFLHIYKFGTICHLVPIQTTNMACIWAIFLNLLSLNGNFRHCYNWFFFPLYSTCVYIAHQ